MDNNGMNKIEAIKQISEIYSVIEGNLKAIIPGPSMIATGIGIMTIPLLELFFNRTVDPIFQTLTVYHAPLIFILRTIFYWTLFLAISYFFKTDTRIKKNALVEKVFAVGKMFPIIPIATAAMLAATGYSELISPIVLILIGSLFALYGQFSCSIVTVIAWANIIAGLVGIWLTNYHIAHLWGYLVCYQGFTFVIMGIFLWYMQTDQDNK